MILQQLLCDFVRLPKADENQPTARSCKCSAARCMFLCCYFLFVYFLFFPGYLETVSADNHLQILLFITKKKKNVSGLSSASSYSIRFNFISFFFSSFFFTFNSVTKQCFRNQDIKLDLKCIPYEQAKGDKEKLPIID